MGRHLVDGEYTNVVRLVSFAAGAIRRRASAFTGTSLTPMTSLIWGSFDHGPVVGMVPTKPVQAIKFKSCLRFVHGAVPTQLSTPSPTKTAVPREESFHSWVDGRDRRA